MSEKPGYASNRIASLHQRMIAQLIEFYAFKEKIIAKQKVTPQIRSAVMDRIHNVSGTANWSLTRSAISDYPQTIVRSRSAMVTSANLGSDRLSCIYDSPSPLRQMAVDLIESEGLTPRDCERLSLVHESYDRATDEDDYKKLLTASLAAFAIIGKLVPEEVFTYYGVKSSYPLYQVWLTAITIGIAIGIICMYAITGFRTKKRRTASSAFADMLVALKLEMDDPSPVNYEPKV